jgi:hypothetical protein
MISPEIGKVVLELKRAHGDLEIADWLVRPNRKLQGASPLALLQGGGRHSRVIEASHTAGPRPQLRRS